MYKTHAAHKSAHANPLRACGKREKSEVPGEVIVADVLCFAREVGLSLNTTKSTEYKARILQLLFSYPSTFFVRSCHTPSA